MGCLLFEDSPFSNKIAAMEVCDIGKLVYPYQFGQMHSLAEVQTALRQSSLVLPLSEDLSVLKEPVMIGGAQAPNAIAVQPLEGADCSITGAPTERTRMRYERFARGGAGIIWFEACAVSRDGRENPHQMYLNQASVYGMKRLVQEVDRCAENSWGHRPYKVLQLTHSGRASRDDGGNPIPLAAFRNPYLDSKEVPPAIVSDERLERLEEEMKEAAALAAEAGFDAVDIKLCHNYLIRELLAAFTRDGAYGGSFENRTRFARNVIRKIQNALGDAIGVAVRLNAYDAIPYPYGWGMAAEPGVMKPDLEEPKQLVSMLYQQGVRLFNISSMMPRYVPWGRGYLAGLEKDSPIFPYAGVEALLQATRELKRAVPCAKLVGTGLSWFQPFGLYVGAGGVRDRWFDIAGFGRQALADPEFAVQLLRTGTPGAGKRCVFCDGCYRRLEQGVPVNCVMEERGPQSG